MAYPLPDPPLADEVVRLRPWTEADAPALAAAWADDEIRRWTAVPDRPDEDHARRWIAGERVRRERGLGLDLVISPAGGDTTVLGEVGIATIAGGPDRAEAGWWVGPDHRRQGRRHPGGRPDGGVVSRRTRPRAVRRGRPRQPPLGLGRRIGRLPPPPQALSIGAAA